VHAVGVESVRASWLHPRASVFGVLVPELDATWGVDFARADGTAGILRLTQVGARCWCWAYLVGPDVGLVVLRDHDVAPPRRGALLDVRAEGLWMELVCEAAGEHWTFGLEAFAVRLDGPRDALQGELGERLPVGLDLEWETDDRGTAHGRVHGEVLVGDDRIELDAPGVLRNAVAPETAWPREWRGTCFFPDGRWVEPAVVAAEPVDAGVEVPTRADAGDGIERALDLLALVPVPLSGEASGSGPVLVRVLVGLRGDADGRAVGWLEVLQSRGSARGEGR